MSTTTATAAVQSYSVASSSSAGKRYQLVARDGYVSCSCPGFMYRRRCRHARALKEGLASGQVPDGYTLEG